MSNYAIRSIQTGQFVTAGNRPGTPVITSSDVILPLSFSRPLSGSQTFTSIRGPSGLYIGQRPGGNILMWYPGPYTWNVVQTSGGYRLIPADGQDLFWTQDDSTSPMIYLLPGGQITGDIASWEIIPSN